VKQVKILGSLSVVAVLATALIGPSLAMGESTALCKVDESPCTSSVSHVHYVADDATILTSFMNYDCDILLLAVVSELGSPQVLEGNLTYSNCSGGCVRTEISESGTLFILKTGHEKADVTGEGVEIFADCGSALECVYTLENLTGKAIGPLLSSSGNGGLTYTEAVLSHVEGGGFFCPQIAKLDANFVPLSPTYISS
jgi:hypothetical protein